MEEAATIKKYATGKLKSHAKPKAKAKAGLLLRDDPALYLAEKPAARTLAAPVSYRGLYAFHKYWGKKPSEPMRYLIQHLCSTGGLVVDPFLGSGISALEAVNLRRRFVGMDINPAAVRIARLLVSPPSAHVVDEALRRVSVITKNAILESYATEQKKPATHYVWRNDVMEKVWFTNGESRTRIESPPTPGDVTLAERFASYQPQALRAPRFFTNSRINSSPSLTLKSLFTGRALRNIELLLSAIDNLPEALQEPLRLSLTASVGQMSKMVFAITGRGKTTGVSDERMEVGSWVIGYWRPEQHFEVNVWNCFERRVQKLSKAITDSEQTHLEAKPGDAASVCKGDADFALVNGNALQLLPELPDRSVDLVITDPPHGDRIPYLELSEMWNVILGEEPPFESEIVVSNAKERKKTTHHYNQAMSKFLEVASRKLRDSGFLVLFFNARTEASWKFVTSFSGSANTAGMTYCGCFPLVYSASSVVQDNREGALRTDYGLVFSRSADAAHSLSEIPGWMSTLPTTKK
ncbi:MAG TPA: DNA methyltransferase [Verrucomicrobiae bacterium]|nr:DNA methyltransferase [Verrucomicrobiae bacterium]